MSQPHPLADPISLPFEFKQWLVDWVTQEIQLHRLLGFRPVFTDPSLFFGSGTGSPETVITAAIGSLYTRTDGGASTTLYVKESGTGNTGWVAK